MCDLSRGSRLIVLFSTGKNRNYPKAYNKKIDEKMQTKVADDFVFSLFKVTDVILPAWSWT